MEKINLEELRLTEEYKSYLKMLISSNNVNVGYDKSHIHITPFGMTSKVIGNNFFLHQHELNGRLIDPPDEYDPITLEHKHPWITLNRNGANEESSILKP